MNGLSTTHKHIIYSCIMGLLILSSTGCSLYRSMEGPMAISARRVPQEFLGHPRSEMVDLSFTRLRQDVPEVYQLDANDVLGVYIENVIGDPEELPPVHYPEKGDDAPSIGFPIPVREDGTIALPLVEPLDVKGLSLTQTTDLIRKAYTIDKKILTPGKDRIIVTLTRKRKHRILVVREENGGEDGVTKRGTGHTIDLDAYENDLLHALSDTGGMPGLDAKNDIIIFRGKFKDGVERDRLLARINSSKDPCSLGLPDPEDPNTTIIPIRYFPQNMPEFKQKDIILKTGDIVVIQSREREKYYTGGTLGGGEQLIPRDYDLDILQAVALAGGAVGAGSTVPSGGGSGGFGGGARGGARGGQVPPSKAIILRKVSGNRQIAIRVDLTIALENPAERILIQPEDVIIVRYTFAEDVWNAALGIANVNFLFSGFSGNGTR